MTDASSDDRRRFDVALHRCIDPACGGELIEVEYFEAQNWITAGYRCARCKREFTMKIET